VVRRARARKAARRLKTIAGQVVRQLDKTLPTDCEERRWLEVAQRVLRQKRCDADKVYSLQEPQVYCLSKGKEHKKYEFGAKASLVMGKNSGVILGAYSLPKNDDDGHTLDPALAQVERLAGYRPAVVIADHGYRGKYRCGDAEVITPKPPKAADSLYARRKARPRFRRRASIEPRIGHLKSDHRLSRAGCPPHSTRRPHRAWRGGRGEFRVAGGESVDIRSARQVGPRQCPPA
jgi:IS5 family transposase